MRIHPQGQTTPRIWQEVKDCGLSDREAAKDFNITRATSARWLKRDDVRDHSHRAHTLPTTLSATQEAIVRSLRQSLYLPLDDLLYMPGNTSTPPSRRQHASLACSSAKAMAHLEYIHPKAEGEALSLKKTFKGYEPGFVHIDIKYLQQMPCETSRRSLCVAFDPARRWVFLHIYGNTTCRSSVDFPRRLEIAPPINITKILTDSGLQFTDRFAVKDTTPRGRHAFY